MGTQITLTAADGHTLAAYRADPEGTPRGAIVVVQEIFGAEAMVPMTLEGLSRGMKTLTR